MSKETNSHDEKDKWTADSAELEAAIALHTWASVLQFAAGVDEKEKGTLFASAHSVKHRRILAATRSGSLESIAKQIRLWTDTNLLDPREAILDVKRGDMMRNGTHTAASPAILWTESDNGVVYTPLRYRMLLKSHRRFFGWNSVDSEIPLPESTGPLTVLSSSVEGSLSQMYAQDIFTGVLRALLSACDRPLGDLILRKSASGYVIENQTVKDLTDVFVQNGLGSKRDAAMCIIPVILASDYKKLIQDATEAVYRSASKHVINGTLEQAESQINWIIPTLEDEPDEPRVRKLFFPLSGLYKCLVERLHMRAESPSDIIQRVQSGMIHIIRHCKNAAYNIDTLGLVLDIEWRLQEIAIRGEYSIEWSPDGTGVF